MVGQHLFRAALMVAIFIAVPGMCQTASACEPCVSVNPLPGQESDEWSGFYSFKEINEECPNKCAYTHPDNPGTVYCFGSGPRTGEYKCPLTDPTKEISDNPTSSLPSVETQGSLTTGQAQGGLTTSQAQGDPSTGQAEGGPTTGQTEGGPTTGQAEGGPTTGQAEGGPTTGQAEGGSTTGQAEGGPTTGQAEGGPTTGQAQGGITTGEAQGGPTTSESQAGLTTGNGEGQSAGIKTSASAPTATNAKISSTSSSNLEIKASTLSSSAGTSMTSLATSPQSTQAKSSINPETQITSTMPADTSPIPSSTSPVQTVTSSSTITGQSTVSDSKTNSDSSTAETVLGSSTGNLGSTTGAAASVVSTSEPATGSSDAVTSTGVTGGDSSTATTKQAVTTVGSITSTAPDCATGSIAESCEPGWSQSQKKCYKLTTIPFGVSWDDANAGCKAIGAELASIESQCDQDKVFELSAKVSTWIGGNDKTTEGTFVWPNGDEFYKSSAAVSGVFTKLSTGFNSNSQSTQHCVTMKDSGEWDDIVCTKFQNYICEKTAYVGAATFVPPTTDAATTVACSGTCATGWTTVGCNCYKFQAVAKTWQSATDECTTLGTVLGKTGRLVTVTSLSLEIKLLELSSNSEFWTGGNDKTKQETFVWDLDGTTFYKDGVETGYNNWWKTTAVDQPNHGANQDCVKFRVKVTEGTNTVEKLGWDDVACDKDNMYICQYSNA